MASEEKLERAYKAIGALRARGYKALSVEQVAEFAGLARSTFYVKGDKDWEKVRRVIKGESTDERAKLVEIEVTDASRAHRRISLLEERLKNAESKFEQLRQESDRIMMKLVAQVQKFLVKTNESPNKVKETADRLKQLSQLKREVMGLRHENNLLLQQMTDSGVVTSLARKDVILVPPSTRVNEIFTPFTRYLNSLVAGEGFSPESVKAFYIAVGLPMAGMPDWIRKHKPPFPGIHIYVDATSHTKDIRNFYIDNIRSIFDCNIHCVYFAVDAARCEARAQAVLPGAACAEMESMIRQIDESFQPPDINENFDTITFVR